MVRRPLGMFCLGVSLLILLIIELAKEPEMEEYQDGQAKAVVTGTVYRKETRQQNGKTAQVLYLKGADTGEAGKSRIICYLKPEQEEALIGSTVRLSGKLSAFEKASNPGQFDSYSYYQISEISFRLSQAELLAKSTTYSIIREDLYQLRTFLGEQLTEALPPKEAGIMQTMLLGDKAALDDELKALYQRNGIAHILAISGLHISLLGMGFYRLLRRVGVPMKAAAGAGIIFLVLYGAMTGFSVSAVRAIIMFSFQMTAIILERSYDTLTALGVAGVLLLLRQPLYWHHSGFVFSFGCVLGIALMLPILTKEADGSVWGKLLSGCAVAAITFPIYLNFYYQFPTYSVVLNLAVLPMMSLLLAGGIILILLRIFCLPLSFLPALLIRVILWFYEWLCNLADKLPGKLLTPGMPGKWQRAAMVLILLFILLFQKKMRLWMRWSGVLSALLILTWHPESGLVITFLDVGQGDCIYVENRNGQSYLIDGGSSSVNEVGKYRIIPFLKYQGTNELEAVFVTHSDGDHCNGILELLEEASQQGITVKNLVLADISEESRDETYREIEGAALNAGVPISYMSAGQRLQDEKLQIVCLHPSKGFASAESNACSIVLELVYGDFLALLTGDIEGEGERQLIAGLESRKLHGKITVLKAAHHGSGNATSENFLALTSPACTVISCGKNNSYGHPHAETLTRLKEAGSLVLRTDKSGAVTFWTKGKSCKWSSFLKGSF